MIRTRHTRKLFSIAFFLILPGYCGAYDAPFSANAIKTPSLSPKIAVSNQLIKPVYHIVYSKHWGPFYNQQVYYMRSSDYGNPGTWSEPVKLSNHKENSANYIDVAIATSESRVYVVWTCNDRLYFRKSVDNGLHFEPAYDLSADSEPKRMPVIAIDGNDQIHIAWSQGEKVLYMTGVAADQGSWSPVLTALGEYHYYPAIHADDKFVYIAARSYDPQEMRVTRRSLTAQEWDTSASISKFTPGISPSYPQLSSAKSGRLVLVFESGPNLDPNTVGGNTIYYTYSDDHAETWADPVETGRGYMPDVTVTSGGEAHVAWYKPEQNSDGGKIQIIRTRDNGRTWTSTQTVNSSPAKQIHWETHSENARLLLGVPIIHADANQVITAWTDEKTQSVMLARHYEKTDLAKFKITVPAKILNPLCFRLSVVASDVFDNVVADYNGEISIQDELGSTYTPNTVSITNGVAATTINVNGPDGVTNLQIRAVAQPEITGSQRVVYRSGESATDELDFIIELYRDRSGLFTNGLLTPGKLPRAHLYTNALAALVFTHVGVKGSDHNGVPADGTRLNTVRRLFDTINKYQKKNGSFNNLYWAETGDWGKAGSPEPGLPIYSGNNAWYLLALAYFTAATNDMVYIDVIRKLADYLIDIARIPGVSGIVSQPAGNRTHRSLCITEHQAESYAALKLVSLLPELERTGEYEKAAAGIKKFVIQYLWDSDMGVFRTAAKITGTAVTPVESPVSLDAQTWMNLAFAQGSNFDIFRALEYVRSNLMDGDQFNCHDTVQGGVWFEGDSGVWLEGTAQLAFACTYIDYIGNGDPQLKEFSDSLFHAMSLKQDHSGGFQTFSDNYVGKAETVDTQAEKIPALITTAWRYFHIVGFNPLAIDSKVFAN